MASSIVLSWYSSSARVTSAKSQPKVLDVGREVQTLGPIDRTPETPGSGNQGIEYLTQIDQQQKHVESTLNIVDMVCTL